MFKSYSILCTGVYITFWFWAPADAQYFPNASITFQKFEFDIMNRGSFNITPCMRDLMNCFELVRGEVICTYWKLYESVCGTAREHCHDAYLDFDSYTYKFETKENACNYDEWQQYS